MLAQELASKVCIALILNSYQSALSLSLSLSAVRGGSGEVLCFC